MWIVLSMRCTSCCKQAWCKVTLKLTVWSKMHKRNNLLSFNGNDLYMIHYKGIWRYQASEDRLPREWRLHTTVSKLCPWAQRGQSSLGTSRAHCKTSLTIQHALNDLWPHSIHNINVVTFGHVGGAIYRSEDDRHYDWTVGEGRFSRWSHHPASKTVSWKVFGVFFSHNKTFD